MPRCGWKNWNLCLKYLVLHLCHEVGPLGHWEVGWELKRPWQLGLPRHCRHCRRQMQKSRTKQICGNWAFYSEKSPGSATKYVLVTVQCLQCSTTHFNSYLESPPVIFSLFSWSCGSTWTTWLLYSARARFFNLAAIIRLNYNLMIPEKLSWKLSRKMGKNEKNYFLQISQKLQKSPTAAQKQQRRLRDFGGAVFWNTAHGTILNK